MSLAIVNQMSSNELEGASVRAIADVHGEPDLLACAAAGASRLVLLGDLVDRGPDSPGALRLALDLVDAGCAVLVRSNHDDKLYRALIGRPVKVGTNLRTTLDALDAAPDAADLKARFLRIFAGAPFVLQLGRYVFAHGAINPHRFEGDRFRSDADFGADHMALYGEVDGTVDEEGKPRRYYRWVDALPRGVTAIVGHDRRNGDEALLHEGQSGGRAYFLDTGCGLGGPLSFIDLPTERIGQIGRRTNTARG